MTPEMRPSPTHPHHHLSPLTLTPHPSPLTPQFCDIMTPEMRQTVMAPKLMRTVRVWVWVRVRVRVSVRVKVRVRVRVRVLRLGLHGAQAHAHG